MNGRHDCPIAPGKGCAACADRDRVIRESIRSAWRMRAAAVLFLFAVGVLIVAWPVIF